jgi:thioredoxin 2
MASGTHFDTPPREYPSLAARFGAQSIPLLVVLREGREVDRIVGALPRAALEQWLGPLFTNP